MNLRNVAIWTTGVMLVGTTVLPLWIASFESKDIFSAFGIIWLLSGSPILISFVLAKTLERTISTIILLCSTITYAIWYVYWLHFIFFSGQDLAMMVILFIGIWSLPVMLPAWIVAYVLNLAKLSTDRAACLMQNDTPCTITHNVV